MPAAILCLHQFDGALGKSLHGHSPLTTKYAVLPLLWLATLALPSASSSTSPASTLLTALSTRPVHSGRVASAFSATSATASRQACRAGFSKAGSAMSSQENCATIVMVRFLFMRG